MSIIQAKVSGLCGGWQVGGAVTPEEKKLFADAMAGFVGMGLEPMCYAKQVVSGTNYCFICKYTVMTAPPQMEGFAKVYIYKDLQGKLECTGVERIM